MFILGFIAGGLLGILFMALIKNGAMAEKQSLIDESRRALANAEDKITERNKFIKGQKEQIKDLKNRITDLEYNVDYLFNNLSPQKKKLIRPGNQN